MQVGQSRSFMQTMNQSLFKLYRGGDLTLEDALARSSDPDELRTMIEQGGQPGAAGGGRPGAPGGRIRYT
jgi:twitching motility protein PilT